VALDLGSGALQWAEFAKEAEMRKLQAVAPVVVAAAIFLFAVVSTAQDKATFTGTIVQTQNMRLPGGGTFQIKIVVDQWTSVEERERLLGVFKQGGSEALMKELRNQKAGYIVPPAASRWPSWEIDVAALIETEDGKIVRVFTERPIIFGEAYYDTRSKDYEFGIVELKLDKEGKGEGSTIPAVKLSLDEQGNIVAESLPSNTGPQRIMAVKEWQDKKKDEDKKE
jgi:hypothetical protein